MMSYITVNMIWSLITGAMISYMAIPPIVRIAKAKSLVVLPNGRTSHRGAIPMLGGIAIFAGLVMGTSLFVRDGYPTEYQYFIPAFLVIFFLGLKDDILVISWTTRLAGQIIAAFLVVVMAQVRITTFHGMFDIHEIPAWASYSFSIFVFVALVNAYNLIDGIDGLASGLGMLAAGVFGVWLMVLGHERYGVLAFALLGGLIPFYIFNVFGTTNKLFMGDSGSTLMGAVFAILAMKILCCEMPYGAAMNYNALPAMVMAVMVIPITDTLRIFTFRIIKGKSPFAADRNHFHHYLLRLGLSHYQASTAIALLNIAMIAFAWMLKDIAARWVAFLTIGITLLIMLSVKQLVNRKVVLVKPGTKEPKMEAANLVSYPD